MPGIWAVGQGLLREMVWDFGALSVMQAVVITEINYLWDEPPVPTLQLPMQGDWRPMMR